MLILSSHSDGPELLEQVRHRAILFEPAVMQFVAHDHRGNQRHRATVSGEKAEHRHVIHLGDDIEPQTGPLADQLERRAEAGTAHWPTRRVTDGVDRWPFVRRRHTEFELNKDGTIRHMRMDVRMPNGRSPRERGRRVTGPAPR